MNPKCEICGKAINLEKLNNELKLRHQQECLGNFYSFQTDEFTIDSDNNLKFLCADCIRQERIDSINRNNIDLLLSTKYNYENRRIK